MRVALLVLAFAAFAAETLAAAGVNVKPVRNPFWPVGYQGRREAITDGGEAERIATGATAGAVAMPGGETAETEAAETVVEAAPESADEQMWGKALALLKPGGVVTVREGEGGAGQYGMLNGRVFKAGDCVTVRADGRLYKWMIRAFDADGRVRLDRIGVRADASKTKGDGK